MAPLYERVVDLTNVPPAEKEVMSTMSRQSRIDTSGINGDQLIEAIPRLNSAACERVIEGQNNTFIVLGRDRLGGTLHGYGGIGHPRCGTIDIVAGRMSNLVVTEDSTVGPVQVNPNTALDASRVYISQKTDVDKNFNLADGKVGKSVGKAAIAIKSDAVRIIAREGIKLVTGTDIINSRGANLVSVSGIDLIAGNNDSSLQPLVKGESLVETLSSMIDRISELNGIVDAFATYQLELNSKLMNHTHPDVINMAIGAIGGTGPDALTDGSTLPSPKVAKAAMKNIFALNSITKKDLLTNKVNLGRLRTTYLKPFSTEYINSRYNNTN
tara:strand:+ start:398 stop:1378 length:981 start_codon:yes stop_codon:yes gene_type:complete